MSVPYASFSLDAVSDLQMNNVYTAPASGATFIMLNLINPTASALTCDVGFLNPANGTTLYRYKNLPLTAGEHKEVRLVQPIAEFGVLRARSSVYPGIYITGTAIEETHLDAFFVQGLGTSQVSIFTSTGGATLMRIHLCNITANPVTVSIMYSGPYFAGLGNQVSQMVIPAYGTYSAEPCIRLEPATTIEAVASVNDSIDITGAILI